MTGIDSERLSGPGRGIPVDSAGGPTVDPTKNVLDLVNAAVKRIDDMAALHERLANEQLRRVEAVITYQDKLAGVREQHQRELDAAESGRLNSIRQVDREEVAKTAASAQTAIATLATTTNTMAETLRTQVATVAAAAESRQSAFAGDVNKRLSALELSSSEGKGKQLVSDPQIEALARVVDNLVRAQATGTGKSEGLSMSAALIMGGLTVIMTLLGIAGVLYAVLKPATVG